MQKPAAQPPELALSTTEQGDLPLLAGRYQVVSKMVGGMGVVYLCRDIKSDQPIALKTFKPEYLSHRVARDLFLREGTMWVEIGAHPNIVRAHRIERWGDGREVYLVMEWIVPPPERQSPSLRTWLYPGQPLPVQQALLFALHIARGMKHACKKIPGLIHRDLKPENILIGYDGVARITDFGLASTLSGLIARQGALSRTREVKEDLSSSKGAAGTPAYMAPEQWRHKLLDPRTDIYALGCIFYEMLTGDMAANGETMAALKEQHLSGNIGLNQEKLPPELQHLFHLMLAVDINGRYDNWTAVETALMQTYWNILREDAPAEIVSGDQTGDERINTGKSYNMMGLSYLDIGKFNLSVMYFEQAISIARREKEPALEAEGLGNLGMVYLALGYYERALAFINEQLPILKQLKRHAEIGRAFGYLGRTYRRMGLPEKALGFHEQELQIARRLKDEFNEAAALAHLGNVYRDLGHEEKAKALFKTALVKAKKVGDQVRVRIILGDVGQLYLQAGENKEAQALFIQSLEIARSIGDRVGEGEAAGNLADLLFSVGKIPKAGEYYDRALAISLESHDLRRQIIYLDKMAIMHESQQHFSEMLDCYQAAQVAAVEMGTPLYEAQAMYNVGSAHCALGDYYEASQWYKDAIRMTDLAKDVPLKMEVLLGLGKAYRLWGDMDRTRGYYEQYLRLARENEDETAVSNGLMLLGDVYYKTRQTRLAQQFYEEWLELAQQAGDCVGQSKALVRIARVAIENGEFKQAIDLCKKALSLAEKIKDTSLQITAMGDLGLAYQAAGKNWQANRTCTQALKLAEKTGDKNGIAWASFKYALVAHRQEKWSKALSPAKQAATVFVKLNDQEMAKLSRKLVVSLERKG